MKGSLLQGVERNWWNTSGLCWSRYSRDRPLLEIIIRGPNPEFGTTDLVNAAGALQGLVTKHTKTVGNLPRPGTSRRFHGGPQSLQYTHNAVSKWQRLTTFRTNTSPPSDSYQSINHCNICKCCQPSRNMPLPWKCQNTNDFVNLNATDTTGKVKCLLCRHSGIAKFSYKLLCVQARTMHGERKRWPIVADEDESVCLERRWVYAQTSALT